MAITCSWCGAETEESSEDVTFLCCDCAATLKDRETNKDSTKRPWHDWMPASTYPDLNRGDTRRA